MEHRRHSYHRPDRPKRDTKITIPALAGPHVRLVFAEMARQNITYDEVEEGSGILRSTLKAWRHKNAPGLTSIEAVLGFLGWDFVPVPRAKILPKALLDDLEQVVERHGASMQLATAAFLGIAARERGAIGDAFPCLPRRSYPRPKRNKVGAKPADGTTPGVSTALSAFSRPAEAAPLCAI